MSLEASVLSADLIGWQLASWGVTNQCVPLMCSMTHVTLVVVCCHAPCKHVLAGKCTVKSQQQPGQMCAQLGHVGLWLGSKIKACLPELSKSCVPLFILHGGFHTVSTSEGQHLQQKQKQTRCLTVMHANSSSIGVVVCFSSSVDISSSNTATELPQGCQCTLGLSGCKPNGNSHANHQHRQQQNM